MCWVGVPKKAKRGKPYVTGIGKRSRTYCKVKEQSAVATAVKRGVETVMNILSPNSKNRRREHDEDDDVRVIDLEEHH